MNENSLAETDIEIFENYSLIHCKVLYINDFNYIVNNFLGSSIVQEPSHISMITTGVIFRTYLRNEYVDILHSAFDISYTDLS